MIKFYFNAAPNPMKVALLLEELGVPYEAHGVDLSEKAQFSEAFTRISPGNRIPAIVDRDTGLTLMESGAIMMYLAEKYGRFMLEGDERWRVVEWLMWQMGGVGPMLGQVHHFVKHNPGRYRAEAHRLYGTLERRLAERDFVAGAGRGEYSIADMAIWPWISRFEWQQVDLDAYPAVRDWYLRIAARPAVQRGYQVPKFVNEVPMPPG
jgi:GST-like protein